MEVSFLYDRCLHTYVYKGVRTDTQNSEELLSAVQEPGTEPAQEGTLLQACPTAKGHTIDKNQILHVWYGVRLYKVVQRKTKVW